MQLLWRRILEMCCPTTPNSLLLMSKQSPPKKLQWTQAANLENYCWASCWSCWFYKFHIPTQAFTYYELQWTTTINYVQDCCNISLPVATYPWFGWRSDLYQVHICLVLCMQLWTQHAILTMRPLILPSVTTTSPYNHHWSNWSWNSQIYQHIQENQWKSQYIIKYYLKSYIWLQNTKLNQYFIQIIMNLWFHILYSTNHKKIIKTHRFHWFHFQIL